MRGHDHGQQQPGRELLIERLGVENVRATVARLGATGMNVRRGVEDQKAFDQGLNNTTTARGLAVLLEKLARGKAVDARADAEMVAILKRQTFNDGIPAGVPGGTPVAHKTGTITKIHHDAAIVYGPRPYVLVILTRGIQHEKESAALMAAISREVWTARGAPARAPMRSAPVIPPSETGPRKRTSTPCTSTRAVGD